MKIKLEVSEHEMKDKLNESELKIQEMKTKLEASEQEMIFLKEEKRRLEGKIEDLNTTIRQTQDTFDEKQNIVKDDFQQIPNYFSRTTPASNEFAFIMLTFG